MEAEIISIGNELLSGNTLNSNATFIARKLHETGVSVKYIQTIGDNAGVIKKSLEQAMERSQIVLITGGLGPTHDDITKAVIAEYFGSKLIFNEEIYQRIQKKFKKRGLHMPEVNRNQALVPENADLMTNQVGTAPGMVFKKDHKYGHQPVKKQRHHRQNRLIYKHSDGNVSLLASASDHGWSIRISSRDKK